MVRPTSCRMNVKPEFTHSASVVVCAGEQGSGRVWHNDTAGQAAYPRSMINLYISVLMQLHPDIRSKQKYCKG